jgi:SAM-dependent methyltransferase
MIEKLLENLCCPLCQSALILKPFIEEAINSVPDKTEIGVEEKSVIQASQRRIKEGVLLCHECKVYYPIFSYVPVMLPFATNFHRRFAQDNAQQLQNFTDYEIPYDSPHPGEKSVQETFTDQWHTVVDSELSFTYTQEELKLLNQKVWLHWIDDVREDVNTVLNVGCGMGRESVALQDVTASEIYAIDLNFALFKGAELRKENHNLHFVIASLFKIPFKPSSFDLVYSQGVIHHTYSTYEALKSIASHVRKQGYIFIWVYGLDDHLVLKGAVGLITRILYAVENVVRPLISSSPAFLRNILFSILTLIFYPLDLLRVRNITTWKLKNTNHGLRDWLSPKYAFRHSYNEVFEWFEELGFQIFAVQSPSAYRQLFNKRLWGVGVTGKKFNL